MLRHMPEPAPADAPSVLVIVGPTASGKSALALELAERLDAEIVSADSQQLYRGFDVGTAKPSAAELARVPHHLVSAVDPREQMDAARYVGLADAAVADIVTRHRRVIVAGGTGLYVRAFLLGVVPLPRTSPELRARLEEELRQTGVDAMRARLAAVDPVTAESIRPADKVRLLRALEIHALTGEPPSAVRARHGFSRFRYRARILGISPPRQVLYERIDERTRWMFANGLIEEVRALGAQGLDSASAMGSLGYRQALAFVRGEMTIETAIDTACRDTRNYAKRQLSWFRSEPWVEWTDWSPDPGEIVKRAGHLA